MLSQDDVDGAIVLKHMAGLDFGPTLITDVSEVDDPPGSIYHNLPKHRVLHLLMENKGRYVLAASPCEVEEICNYIFQLEPHLRERIHTTIGLLSGWRYNWHSIRAICKSKRIDATPSWTSPNGETGR